MTQADSIKILIAEDEMIIAADIASQLGKMGYELAGISTRGEDVLKLLESMRPDIILMDIALRGKMDGVETAVQILQHHRIPVIFVTSNADDATFQRAKTAKPYAFIAKPFQQKDLQRAIEITLERMEVELQPRPELADQVSTLDDRLFIHDKDQLVKVVIQDILFLEADRNYCKIYTADRAFLVSVPMSNIEQHLPPDVFMRTHRSFIVNLKSVSSINENHESLMIDKHSVPVSRRLKERVISRFRMV